jgi:hypothetical protein
MDRINRNKKAIGGRVGFAEGSDPESYDVPTESPLKISGNFSKSKKSEILDYVASLEIPVSEKIKLIGELTELILHLKMNMENINIRI